MIKKNIYTYILIFLAYNFQVQTDNSLPSLFLPTSDKLVYKFTNAFAHLLMVYTILLTVSMVLTRSHDFIDGKYNY